MKYDEPVRTTVPQLLAKRNRVLYSVSRDIIEKLDRSTYNSFPCDLHVRPNGRNWNEKMYRNHVHPADATAGVPLLEQ